MSKQVLNNFQTYGTFMRLWLWLWADRASAYNHDEKVLISYYFYKGRVYIRSIETLQQEQSDESYE